ncbi:MAG: CehA/McbA family metallohydrolase [Candidatus Shapirobacteria bacterium]|nr:CehA/McbA family metallohydrolase [Candidatus Shapirobacteria bacterium]MDD4410418.1 CehA/McbA family metallohydrolase [Candidatus Shapirobacteria bacterium]
MAPKKKWLKFDLHMHTSRSDGKNSVKEMLMTAKRRGLDVVAITDHNLPNKFNPEKIFEKYGIYVIPGCELSVLNGHILVLGLDPKLVEEKLKQYKIREKTSSIVIRKKTIIKILEYFVENGALIIAAHPKIPSGVMSLKGNFLMNLYKKGLIHGAETHNDDLEKKFKRKFYLVWHKLAKNFMLRSGIPPYANSDAHFKNRIGNRFNMVKLDDPTKLLEVLKKGKIEIRHGTRSDLS